MDSDKKTASPVAIDKSTDTIEITGIGASDLGYDIGDITLSNAMDYPTSMIGTITLGDPICTNVWDQNIGTSPTGRLSLTGDDADIDINGVSLCDTIRQIQDRLNILCPDPEMESEWHELRKIREQYEAKLDECREKSRAWRALQQQG